MGTIDGVGLKNQNPFFGQTDRNVLGPVPVRRSVQSRVRPSNEGNIRAVVVVVVSPPLARPSDERFDSILFIFNFRVHRKRAIVHGNATIPFVTPSLPRGA